MTANMYFALLFSFGFILAGVYAQPPPPFNVGAGTDAEDLCPEIDFETAKKLGSKKATSKNYFYIQYYSYNKL